MLGLTPCSCVLQNLIKWKIQSNSLFFGQQFGMGGFNFTLLCFLHTADRLIVVENLIIPWLCGLKFLLFTSFRNVFLFPGNCLPVVIRRNIYTKRAGWIHRYPLPNWPNEVTLTLLRRLWVMPLIFHNVYAPSNWHLKQSYHRAER